jgi:hypothetical protein
MPSRHERPDQFCISTNEQILLSKADNTLLEVERQLNAALIMHMFVARTAVIDEEIRDWVINDNRGSLSGYEKIIYAGKNGDFHWLDSDGKIATFCKENGYDLFATDKESYTHYFDDNEIHTIQITKHSLWRETKKPIFMIRIIDRR